MATELARYEAARRALAEARRVDEVKDIRDKAKAMQVYAQQAKDRSLIEHATEIRMRAERRAGELLAEMKQKGERDPGGRGRKIGSRAVTQLPKLPDIGISKMQSHRWQKLAALSSNDFEARVERAKQKAEAAINPPAKVNGKGEKKPKAKPSKAIGPIDRCATSIRATVLEIMREMQPTQWPDLFAALRDELNDIEKVAERKRQDGHHAARQPS